MNTKAANPFEIQPDWQHNCCVSNYMQFGELAGYYVRSADALVRAAVDDMSLLDVHVFAICFLYRHGLELLFKDLLWKSHYAVTGQKKLKMRDHRLRPLWASLRANVTRLCGTKLLSEIQDVAELEKLLAQIEDHDLESYSFRYPFDLNFNRTHSNLTHVNIRLLHDTIHRAFECLAAIAEAVDYHYFQKSESSQENR